VPLKKRKEKKKKRNRKKKKSRRRRKTEKQMSNVWRTQILPTTPSKTVKKSQKPFNINDWCIPCIN